MTCLLSGLPSFSSVFSFIFIFTFLFSSFPFIFLHLSTPTAFMHLLFLLWLPPLALSSSPVKVWCLLGCLAVVLSVSSLCFFHWPAVLLLVWPSSLLPLSVVRCHPCSSCRVALPAHLLLLRLASCLVLPPESLLRPCLRSC